MLANERLSAELADPEAIEGQARKFYGYVGARRWAPIPTLASAGIPSPSGHSRQRFEPPYEVVDADGTQSLGPAVGRCRQPRRIRGPICMCAGAPASARSPPRAERAQIFGARGEGIEVTLCGAAVSGGRGSFSGRAFFAPCAISPRALTTAWHRTF